MTGPYAHMCRDERHTEVGYSLSDDDERCPVCRVLDDLAAANERAERHRNALERIGAMAVRPCCACGRPTGTAAILACAHAALRGEDE